MLRMFRNPTHGCNQAPLIELFEETLLYRQWQNEVVNAAASAVEIAVVSGVDSVVVVAEEVVREEDVDAAEAEQRRSRNGFQ